jgi:hypothetical protein
VNNWRLKKKVAARLPRYIVTTVTGFPITASTLHRDFHGPRKQPRIYQIQDTWEGYRVVRVCGLGPYLENQARSRCERINGEHEALLREQGVL